MTDTIVVRADAVALPGGLVFDAAVRVDRGVVTAVVPGPSSGAERLAGTLLPAPIDLQVNGAGGRSVDEASADALDAVARAVRRGGAGAFLPTLITAPFDVLCDQIRTVAEWIASGPPEGGATPLGIHLEGPFLEVAGAHDEKAFLDPTPERVDALLAAAAGRLKLVTMAPGRAGAPAAVARLRAAGVAVSLGHASSPDAISACVDAGARSVTHLFNAMGSEHHRRPGFAAHALAEPRLSCMLIADGVHVHDVVLRNAWRILGPARTILVTDAVAAAGMPEGEYRLQGRPIAVREGVVRDRAGNLAGSAATMARVTAGFQRATGVRTATCLARVVAANAARLLRDRRRGAIVPGAVAELALRTQDGEVRVLDLPVTRS